MMYESVKISSFLEELDKVATAAQSRHRRKRNIDRAAIALGALSVAALLASAAYKSRVRIPKTRPKIPKTDFKTDFNFKFDDLFDDFFKDIYGRSSRARPTYRTRVGPTTRYKPTVFKKEYEARTTFKNFGVDTSRIKTKKQFDERYRFLAKKHHPDIGGSTKNMQTINVAKDNLKKSDWYEKLAAINGFFRELEVIKRNYVI